MKMFNCYLCEEDYPEELKNEHHKKPQSAGGKDCDKIDLCAGCHQTLHAIAKMLKNPKKSGYVDETVELYYPNQDHAKKCRELAFLIIKYDTMKDEGLLDLSDKLMMVSIEIPILYHAALRTLANEHRDPNSNRKMGMNNYTKMLLMNHLEKHYPKIKGAKSLSELLESSDKIPHGLNFQKL